MPLPGIKLEFENGNLGVVATNPDGICGIVSSAVAVSTTFVLEQHYVIYSLKEAEKDLGIADTGGNAELHKTIKEFYAEAGNGTELWIYGVAQSEDFDGLIGKSTGLLDASNRRISAVVVKYFPSTADAATRVAGLSAQFATGLALAQTIAEDYTVEKIQPLVFLLEGYNFSGTPADLASFSTAENNRVAVMIGDTVSDSKGAAIGVLAGRLAQNQVHVNVGRVKDGALKPLNFFIGNKSVQESDSKAAAIHDKGFITLRTHIGKSGFYFTDDLLACTPEDDYHFLARRRVIDKAYRLSHGVLTNYLLDDLNITADGKISPLVAKAIEADVERVIAQEMSAKGELSADVTKANDTGVEVLIDLNEVIATTSTIKGQIKVKPKGYSKYIEFTIGYNINN